MWVHGSYGGQAFRASMFCANYRNHVFAILTKARREAEMLKVPLFCEKIEDMWDEGQSVAVFCNFTETIQAIFKRLSRLKKFLIGMKLLLIAVRMFARAFKI